ncbi:MAG TPA: hypothetical protein VEK07_08105 [Polyangiaceae bacterium]|nr:hypothetical protein [Polyangiaceae bacterium]
MLDPNELWLLEEGLPVDEPVEVLLTMPEIRQLVDPDRDDEQLGLRSIVEQPEALSKAWRQTTRAAPHPRTSKSVKRRVDVLRAA